MHCAACAVTIEETLRRVPGVLEATVSAASRRARVVWSAAEVQPSRWFSAVASTGYALLPAHDSSVRAVRQREARRALWRWLVAGFCMMQVMMYAWPMYTARPGDISPDAAALLRWASWMLSLPVLIFSCGPFFTAAWRAARQRHISMDLPVALGIAITFIVSTAATFDSTGPLGHEVYFDSLTMFVFFLLTGRWLETRLRERTAGALEELMNRLPDGVERLDSQGVFQRVSVRRLAVGDVVRVLPGEAFPADGVIIQGETQADEALLTGESRPVERPLGSRVLAGSHNLASAVQVRVEALGEGTRFAQIVALMERAAIEKPKWARLADRIAQPFLIAVLVAAALAAAYWWSVDPARALMVAVAVLIVTCPCALSLATPAAMLASAGALARRGVMVAKLPALEALQAVDTVVFDKTGTLTHEAPRLTRVHSREGIVADDAIEFAAALASNSRHPVARALVDAWKNQRRASHSHAWIASDVSEEAGAGLRGGIRHSLTGSTRQLRLGSAVYCGVDPLDSAGMQVHLCDDSGWLASFEFEENLRDDVVQAVQELNAAGIEVRILSGDRDQAVKRIGAHAGVALARGDCLPEDKLAEVRHLQAQRHRVAMVGDGLNDGPVLAQADVSFALGNAVALTQSHADFVILGNSLRAIPAAVLNARRTSRVVKQNLFWAAAYNLLCVPLAVAGWLPPWLAGLGMAISSLVVVANALRLARPVAAYRT